VRYMDMPADQLRADYWAWRRLLDNAVGMRSARSTSRCPRRIELIEAIARKRRIRLSPPTHKAKRGERHGSTCSRV
jgi:hypothetical protein